MNTLVHQLVRTYQLTGDAIAKLWAWAHAAPSTARLVQRCTGLLAVVAAIFLGLGVIFWVAANWQDWGRLTQLVLLQAVLAVAVLGAVLVPQHTKLRAALLLLAMLVLGGLLAFVGQTYQTGADPWQLFAAWAALSLLWVLVVRSDALWTFWVLITGAAIALWSGTGLFGADAADLIFGNLPNFGLIAPFLWAGLVLIAACAERLMLRTKAIANALTTAVTKAEQSTEAAAAQGFAYAPRVALLLAVVAWCSQAVFLIFKHASLFGGKSAGFDWALFLLNMGLIAAAGAWTLQHRRGAAHQRDIAALSIVLLAGNVVVLAWVGRGFAELVKDGNWVLLMFVFGLLALGLLGATGRYLQHLQAQQSNRQNALDASKPVVHEPVGKFATASQAGTQLSTPLSAFDYAQQAGLLPAGAMLPTPPASPSWMVTAMNCVGAQFAVIPFAIVFFQLLGFGRMPFAMAFLIGLGFFAAAWFLIQSKTPSATQAGSPQGFVVQLGLCLIGVGLATIWMSSSSVFIHGGMNIHFAMTGFLCVGFSLLIGIAWIRALLCFAGGMMLLLLQIAPFKPLDPESVSAIQGVQQQLMIWRAYWPLFLAALCAAWIVFEAQLSARFGRAAWFEKAAQAIDCMAAAVLVFTAYHVSDQVKSTLSFGNRGNATGSMDSDVWGTAALWQWNTLSFISALLVLAMGVWFAQRMGLWRAESASSPSQPFSSNPLAAQPAQTTQSTRYALALVLLIAGVWALLTYTSHTALAVPVLAAVAAATGRKRLLALAGLVFLAQLSGFYYALQWPLVNKAGLFVMLGTGISAALAAAYWTNWVWGRSARITPAALAAHPTVHIAHSLPIQGAAKGAWAMWTHPRYVSLAVAAGGILALAAVNWDVRGKEHVMAQGQKIYIPLVPRDPRSLMQGDYMALNFMRRFNPTSEQANNRLEGTLNQPYVWASLDERGVASVLDTVPTAEQTQSNTTVRLPLKYKKGQWILVTDAYFFPEGQGEPFTKAQFGEFRVLPDGRALLVGLADAQLNALKPAPKTPKALTPSTPP